MQQRLKQVARSAWAWIIAAKFLKQLFLAVDDAIALLDLRLRREALSALTCHLESRLDL
jgi:hypothetical protein